ncbi:MAG: archease [Candidatus Nanoarchaeia archaeon]|nr:archease [Candidatus Nanoarchaeia archaeon]MDD5053978.1 archease [Candidatus Nanoarchaeia archaeon]MDD5499635.1 archease [Candidatus Nanoarchaeia archaeon]
MKYEYLIDEATADLAIKAYGETLKEAFENSALAVCEAICETENIDEQEIKLVKKKADNLKMLLYDFLEEIIFLHDAENMVFKRAEIDEFDEKNCFLSAVFFGENFDNKKHVPKAHIKAITYFDMGIENEKNKAAIKFIVDV